MNPVLDQSISRSKEKLSEDLGHANNLFNFFENFIGKEVLNSKMSLYSANDNLTRV